ncbi:MAG TPA: aldo/keto reductase [Longimicrobium sp.]|jgi:aryl-alcohol dehydrogenase-like predicted oxidoreductase|nr:aldo/keto reductase [Longimicrobium sp.]
MTGGIEMRELGGTELAVSRLGLGMAALGRPGYMVLGHAEDLAGGTAVDAMRARAHEVLDTAWALGIRYVDAARSYGLAEEFVASWLAARGIPLGEMVIGSKWGYAYTAGWRVDAEVHEVKEHTPEQLARQSAESLALLGRHLRLYQIHSATLETGVLANGGVIAGLARLKEDGLRIGLSLTGARQADTLRRTMEIHIDGVRLFDAVQATWNVLEPSAGSALQEAQEAGMGVIVKEALANGRLTSRNTSAAHSTDLAVLRAEADRLGTTIDALALAAALAQPWADVVLSGAATVAHLRSNAAAPAVALDAEACERLGTLAWDPEAYWDERSRLPWT